MVEFLSDKNIRLHFESSPAILEKIVELSVEKRWRLRQINLEKSSLDDIFAQLSAHQPGNNNAPKHQ
jgi:ABC-2 type transport system ATP-binding protein